MADWITWSVIALVAVVLELFTGTFYLLMLAVGLAAGALAALGGLSTVVQALIAAVVAAVATELLRRKRGTATRIDASVNPDVNLDIGQQVNVDTWNGTRARVLYRGAQWDAELAPGAEARPGAYRIMQVLGSRLILSNQ
ncbi:NfeD family protein [Massilia arenosa]|uniref:NfeD family protein n=1 Tax=Zemynaea arenosa TaxID=2561931 RepID=A0A4Y9SAS6_9BURK|nr:NfeD family protein [Massilia arenosa]TFW18774.1 NfeD family protein [Massilia arenosa]